MTEAPPPPAPRLAVTTAHRPTTELRRRAELIAERCQAPIVERQSLAKLRRFAELIYVVGRDEECIFSEQGRMVGGEGLLKLKRVEGRRHPLIRAVAPEAAEPTTVLDATLGLAQDALHLCVIVEALRVDGIEASAPLVCLNEDFLGRAGVRWGDAAGRVRPRVGDASEALSPLAADAYDVVFFDPMFDAEMPSQPDFHILRQLAREAPLDPFTLAEAVRVARQRVVVKVRTMGQPGVEPPPPGWNRRVSGRAFDYWIIEKALPNPTLDPLRVKYSHQKLRWLGLM